jgi:hypothetical protein
MLDGLDDHCHSVSGAPCHARVAWRGAPVEECGSHLLLFFFFLVFFN